MNNKKRFLEHVNALLEEGEEPHIITPNDKWLNDFFEFYDILIKINPKVIGHPKYKIHKESYNTLIWNISWYHADYLNK